MLELDDNTNCTRISTSESIGRVKMKLASFLTPFSLRVWVGCKMTLVQWKTPSSRKENRVQSQKCIYGSFGIAKECQTENYLTFLIQHARNFPPIFHMVYHHYPPHIDNIPSEICGTLTKKKVSRAQFL